MRMTMKVKMGKISGVDQSEKGVFLFVLSHNLSNTRMMLSWNIARVLRHVLIIVSGVSFGLEASLQLGWGWHSGLYV